MQFDESDPEQAAIVELRKTNIERLNALNMQGVQIGVDRKDAILEWLLDAIGGTTPERLEFERTHAQGINDQLDQIEAQVRHAKLTQGVAGLDPNVPAPVPMNRQQRRAADRNGR